MENKIINNGTNKNKMIRKIQILKQIKTIKEMNHLYK